jgi:hypothetical protein
MAIMIQSVEEQQPKRKQQLNRVKGENVHTAKLRERDVKVILLLYAHGILKYPKLAETYGVSASAIGDVVNKHTWKHVHDCI